MSLTSIVAINAVLDAALLGSLAWALSRPARLTPHRQEFAPTPVPLRQRTSHSGPHGPSDWSVRTSRATA
jgi:hypothetical protein